MGNTSDLDQALIALLNQGYLEQVNDDVYAFTDKTSGAKTDDTVGRPTKLTGNSYPNTSNPDTAVSRYVHALANRHKVHYEPTFSDRWASSVTRLADDDVKSDRTDDLLVALRRAGKLSPKDMTKLVISHHREARRV